MTQATAGTIDPTTTSGSDLAALLTEVIKALQTNNKGSSAPSYITAGMTWIDASNPNLLVWKFFDGTDHIPLMTINTVTNTATPVNSPTTTAPGVPSSRAVNTINSITGGGNLSADRTLSLVGDAASPGGNKFYGTDSIGTKGWQASPRAPNWVPRLGYWTTPGTYNWTVPGNVTRVKVTIVGNKGYLGIGQGGRAVATYAVTPGGNVYIGIDNPASALNVQSGDVNFNHELIAHGGKNVSGSPVNGTMTNTGGAEMLEACPDYFSPAANAPLAGFVLIEWLEPS